MNVKAQAIRELLVFLGALGGITGVVMVIARVSDRKRLREMAATAELKQAEWEAKRWLPDYELKSKRLESLRR